MCMHRNNVGCDSRTPVRPMHRYSFVGSHVNILLTQNLEQPPPLLNKDIRTKLHFPRSHQLTPSPKPQHTQYSSVNLTQEPSLQPHQIKITTIKLSLSHPYFPTPPLSPHQLDFRKIPLLPSPQPMTANRPVLLSPSAASFTNRSHPPS